MVNIDEFLKELIEKKGSDLHLKVGLAPMLRLRGDLVPLEKDKITSEDMEGLIHSLLTPKQKEKLENERELDFSFSTKTLPARFRANLFFQKGMLGAVFRVIPMKMPSLDELGLPPVLKEIASRPQGLVLVTGPTGSGKSTTLAAIVAYINENFPKHIITIEDPLEFIHEDKKSIINQRELGADTLSFAGALKRALRQDPDVILVGEMRDEETISTAFTAAETGHLVFSTLHTNDAKQSIDRIVNTFPPEAQFQVRMALANTLLAVVAQRLIKRADGNGRVAVLEILINTSTIKKLIEENKIGTIAKTMEESATLYHMQTFNQALFNFWKEKLITEENALSASPNPNDLKILFQTTTFGQAQKIDSKKTS
ncbi:MAG TPA: type IV pili twitching motility protein PilT [Elusimicrobia bacterium]|nr:type IV pili twitching motility protein PilT [Elusimicrobiota bacterium]